MLNDKILELIDKPNYYTVSFEHAIHSVYFCTCYINDHKYGYRGVGDNEELAFDSAYEKYNKWKRLGIDIDYDFPGGQFTKGSTTISIDNCKTSKRKVVTAIDDVDEDGFTLLGSPQSFRDFKIANRVYKIYTEGAISIYKYQHIELMNPGQIKVCERSMKIIAIKEDKL